MQTNKYDDMILDFAEKSEISVDEKTILVIEDTDNKQWVLYRTHKGYTTIPFGYITANIIFEYLARLKDDVHHDKLMKWYDEVGFEYDKETGEKDVQYLKPFLVKLQEVILNLGKYRQNEHKAEMKAALLDTWKMYRNAKYVSMWKDIIDLSEDNEENYKGDSWLPEEEMLDSIKGNHEEAIELESTTYNLHIKKGFHFCDYITFYDKNNVPLTGRGYIARTDADIFASDLYHVLVSGLAGIPRLCPRCGHIFYPSNKSKYCDECKKDSSIIKNEKRRQSVRYFHKKVYDKITLSSKYDSNFRNDFINESNYYWDVLRGKEVTPNPLYRERIKTEAQYQKWLEKKLHSL